jgi:hypothetical protein
MPLTIVSRPRRSPLARLPTLTAAGLALSALLIPLASCADDAEFSAKFAPDYPQTPHASVSTFGVFKDGRMSAEAWDALAPLLMSPGGVDAALSSEDIAGTGGDAGAPPPSDCPAAFDTALVAKDMNLFTAVDSYTRANGVTDGLLDKLAQSAKGDLIMVVTISGHVPVPQKDGGGEAPAMQGPSAPMGGSGRGGMVGRRGMPGTSMRRGGEERQSLDMAASFYSRSLKRAVGVVGMSYTGKNPDEALRQFAAKLKATLGVSPCAGWSELHLTEDALQHIEE